MQKDDTGNADNRRIRHGRECRTSSLFLSIRQKFLQKFLKECLLTDIKLVHSAAAVVFFFVKIGEKRFFVPLSGVEERPEKISAVKHDDQWRENRVLPEA